MVKDAIISIDAIKKSFKKHQVLDGVSFAIQPGEIFGLIGLNGVGKTTLIKIMLGLLSADAGSVKFFGHDHVTKEARRKLCFIPERFRPSHLLTGDEFLSLSQSYYGLKYDKNRARELALELDLRPDALASRTTDYSKGMGQKLGLLSALLSEVPLLVLDEPMSGLDPKARILFKEVLMRHAGKNRAIFFSSHILNDMDEICGRIGILHDRQMQFIGKPSLCRKQQKAETLERAFISIIERDERKIAA